MSRSLVAVGVVVLLANFVGSVASRTTNHARRGCVFAIHTMTVEAAAIQTSTVVSRVIEAVPVRASVRVFMACGRRVAVGQVVLVVSVGGNRCASGARREWVVNSTLLGQTIRWAILVVAATGNAVVHAAADALVSQTRVVVLTAWKRFIAGVGVSRAIRQVMGRGRLGVAAIMSHIAPVVTGRSPVLGHVGRPDTYARVPGPLAGSRLGRQLVFVGVILVVGNTTLVKLLGLRSRIVLLVRTLLIVNISIERCLAGQVGRIKHT